jgi:hypothetical protein
VTFSQVQQISKLTRSSPQRSQEFKKTITIVNAINKDTKLKLLNLILDVVTRWNSTYFMVKRVQDLRPVCFVFHFFSASSKSTIYTGYR